MIACSNVEKELYMGRSLGKWQSCWGRALGLPVSDMLWMCPRPREEEMWQIVDHAWDSSSVRQPDCISNDQSAYWNFIHNGMMYISKWTENTTKKKGLKWSNISVKKYHQSPGFGVKSGKVSLAMVISQTASTLKEWKGFTQHPRSVVSKPIHQTLTSMPLLVH